MSILTCEQRVAQLERSAADEHGCDSAATAFQAGFQHDARCRAGFYCLEIEDFRQAAPSSLTLYGVRVLEPETGREVARVRQLEWVSSGDQVPEPARSNELHHSAIFKALLLHNEVEIRVRNTLGNIITETYGGARPTEPPISGLLAPPWLLSV